VLILVIGGIMVEYAKSNDNNMTTYGLNDMNSMSYAVEGGMEDWAYAGSWENSYTPSRPIKKCNPSTKEPYGVEKTNYDDVTLRSQVYLVENADTKQPNADTLGCDDNIFDFCIYL
jgi:hypothetical protein